jgi:hypothetical protein
VIVPRCINDEQLKKVACFRSSKRFPAVVWRSKKTGAVLARSSQPNVGLLAWRLNEDELLLKAIADCCSLPLKHHHHHSSKDKNLNGGSAAQQQAAANAASLATQANGGVDPSKITPASPSMS